MDLPELISPPFDPDDFEEIIDVRSPSEFLEDHIPGAINLPVLSEHERHLVGELNATNPFEARKLGATYITQNIHLALSSYFSQKPSDYSPLVYCWRGNLRSHSISIILRAIGWRTRVLQGGYKAWRKWLISNLQDTIGATPPHLIILGGLTGCGKTRLLHALKSEGGQVLDLEAMANHRGSILGTEPDAPQPSQKKFETLLWSAFRQFDPSRPVFTEAESNRIGRLQCPPALWNRLRKGRVVHLELPLAERVKLLMDDYQHFTQDPELLKTTLRGLRRRCGNDLIAEWNDFIDQEQWSDYLSSILSKHYDLVYRIPGSEDSIYQEPSETLALSSSSSEEFDKAARSLLERYQ